MNRREMLRKSASLSLLGIGATQAAGATAADTTLVAIQKEGETAVKPLADADVGAEECCVSDTGCCSDCNPLCGCCICWGPCS